jgi:HAD superfamily phosphoserine phosphatase-like hydrolase
MPAATTLIHRHFSPEVAGGLDAALVPGAAWVTDADGTLWNDDIGEAFLRTIAAEGALVSAEARGVDVWATYEAKCRVDKREGYGWAVQVMAGLEESALRQRCEAFARAFVPSRAFEAMRALVAECEARGVTPWIVSASHQWVVRAAAPLVGIDPRRAFGLTVEVEGGVLTGRLAKPFTFREGKAAAVQALIAERPALVSGDSTGDAEMLEIAGTRLVIAHRGADPSFIGHARARGWLVQAL